jgi:hypothetical protein
MADENYLVTLKMVTLNPCNLTRWSTRVNQLRRRLESANHTLELDLATWFDVH